MSPELLRLYALYGTGLLDGSLKAKGLATELGHTSDSKLRAVRDYAREHGPPADSWRVVVIPDAHFEPNHGGLERARLFGQYITYQGREAMRLGEKFAVVCIGDFDEAAAASFHSKGTRFAEGKRIIADYIYANEAIRLVDSHISPDVQEYLVRKDVTLGNHEVRAMRIADQQPELVGMFGLGLPGEDDAIARYEWDKYGWTVHPFLQPLFIDGVAFMHYLPNPGTGKAVASVNQARTMLSKALVSVVCGHNHVYTYDTATRLDGRKIAACTVGCAFEHDHDWAGHVPNTRYDRGMVTLHALRDGFFSATFHDFSAIRRLTRAS